jgi:hypothetical protein
MLTAASIALLLQLGGSVGPSLIQGGAAVIVGQQQVQVAYYNAVAAYWNAQRRCCCAKAKRKGSLSR